MYNVNVPCIHHNDDDHHRYTVQSRWWWWSSLYSAIIRMMIIIIHARCSHHMMMRIIIPIRCSQYDDQNPHSCTMQWSWLRSSSIQDAVIIMVMMIICVRCSHYDDNHHHLYTMQSWWWWSSSSVYGAHEVFLIMMIIVCVQCSHHDQALIESDLSISGLIRPGSELKSRVPSRNDKFSEVYWPSSKWQKHGLKILDLHEDWGKTTMHTHRMHPAVDYGK